MMRARVTRGKGWVGKGLILAVFLLPVGCSNKGTVKGTVTYKDKPVAGGKITFTSEKGPAATGVIEEDGTYTVTKVPPGPAKISIFHQAPKPAQRGPGGFGGPPKDKLSKVGGPPKDALPKDVDPGKIGYEATKKPANFVPIPEKYEDPNKSGLTLDVKSGEQTHNIELK